MRNNKIQPKLKAKTKLTVKAKTLNLIKFLDISYEDLEQQIEEHLQSNIFIENDKNFNFNNTLSEIDYDYTEQEKTLIEEIEPYYLALVPNELEQTALDLLRHIDKNGILDLETDEFIATHKITHLQFNEIHETLKNLGPTGFAELTLKDALEIRKQLGETGTPLGSYNTQAIYNVKKNVDIIFYNYNGEIYFQIQEPYLPEINLENYIKYKNIKDKKTIEFIEKIKEKYFLLKSFIIKRKTFLKNISELLLKTNSDYFKNSEKINFLKIRETARKLQVSPSTISRTVRNKVIQLPNGQLMELSFFFDTKKTLIIKKKIINKVIKENFDLSDNKIQNILENDYKIKIARRTVNKYKNELKEGEQK
jgi:RNA polymerase sigma-54 factor